MKQVIRKCALVSACLSLVFIGACQAPPKTQWDLPQGLKTLSAEGYPMAYMERGTGPTVVLVHGALNDYRYWSPQLDSLASRFRVVSVSLRHYYPEPWKGEGEFSMVRHARDLAAFIEGIGAPVFLVGHSRAGPVVLATAQARPELVRKLVLADPALFSLLPGAAAGQDDPRVKRAKQTETYFRRGDMEGGLRYFFDDVNGPGSWDRLPEEQRRVRRENAWTIIGQISDQETITCTQMGALRMPVLTIDAERTPRPFKNMGDAARKCMPSARHVTIPNAGHQMNQHNAPAFDAALVKFLTE